MRNTRNVVYESEGEYFSPHLGVSAHFRVKCWDMHDGMNIRRDRLRCLCLTTANGRWASRGKLLRSDTRVMLVNRVLVNYGTNWPSTDLRSSQRRAVSSGP